MSDILCVTNRGLCREDFLERIEAIAKEHPAGIILREKDLTPKAYETLAKEVLAICAKYDVLCMFHTYPEVAIRLGCPNIHLPLPVLRRLSEEEKAFFARLGTSCHSISDVEEAGRLGCSYIVAGHIFETDCKKGLPGRGLTFLKETCEHTQLPVYAIGGIDHDNYKKVCAVGAKGACVMSGAMTAEDIKTYLGGFDEI